MKKFLDVQLPFFIPLRRRVITVVACLGWSLLELAWGNIGWAALFGAVGLYCAHQFFIAFDPPAAEGTGDAETDAPEKRHNDP